jgi:hypothetical protein
MEATPVVSCLHFIIPFDEEMKGDSLLTLKMASKIISGKWVFKELRILRHFASNVFLKGIHPFTFLFISFSYRTSKQFLSTSNFFKFEFIYIRGFSNWRMKCLLFKYDLYNLDKVEALSFCFLPFMASLVTPEFPYAQNEWLHFPRSNFRIQNTRRKISGEF